ncbi:hypothetical protein DUNSADRAFT_6469 [Dunaliella salina]|uniref:TPR-like protein n=1 Tax=Dunaliella salina TaxID=3046 RepID=A0ABQ7GNF3_DUNSA|nr:hypothetical protein DUNSADRAFT_6469 [Dunaliella salina]|eukprot:KAF5836098.1 hypothetical protein DUNSADRAFT_6469 [Dunaliella salina]
MRSAEDGLRRCLDLDPGDGRTYVVLGKLLTMNKRYDEARKLYTEGCQNTGNTNPYIWSAWGWLEFKTANIERARKLFDAATVVSPTHAAAWHKWGFMEKSEGKYGRARDLWLKGISLCKQQGTMKVAYLYNALACMSAQLGNVREARFWFKEGTSNMGGKNATALWQAWCVLEAREKELPPNQMRQCGNVDRARQLFQEGVWADPRSTSTAVVLQAWGMLERKNKNYQLARELFKAAVKVDSKNEAVWGSWITMERDLGFTERADELEIKLNENRWEFEVPAGFTTRVDSSPVTALARMTDMLRRFFTIRGDGKGSASRESAGAQPAPSFGPMSADGSPATDSALAAEMGAPELFNSGSDSDTAESGALGGSSPRSTSQPLQLDDVLPRSVREAQAGELQQQQQLLASYPPPSKGQQQTLQPPQPTAAPSRKAEQASQPLRQPVQAAQPSSAPQGVPSTTQPRAPSPQYLHQHQPANAASTIETSTPARANSPQPTSTPAASDSEPGPRASPPPPPRTTTTSIRGSKFGPSSRPGLGVGKGGGGVARPVRDAALTAAGREVEKPLEMALQDLLLDDGSGNASRFSSSSDISSDSSDGEDGVGRGASVLGNAASPKGERLADGPWTPGLDVSNGNGNGRGNNGTEASGRGDSGGSSSSRASPGLGSSSESKGGQQQKSVGQQLLELVGEVENKDTE